MRPYAAWASNSPRPSSRRRFPPRSTGRDVLASAETGSGKTAAFLLPIMNKLLPMQRGATRALVLAPTRELAAQIAEHFQRARSGHVPHLRRRLRRRGHGQPGARVPQGRGHDRRLPRPASRPHAGPLRRDVRTSVPRPGRGGPDARHGLPARHQEVLAGDPEEPPDAVLLRHPARRPSSSLPGICCAIPRRSTSTG